MGTALFLSLFHCEGWSGKVKRLPFGLKAPIFPPLIINQ